MKKWSKNHDVTNEYTIWCNDLCQNFITLNLNFYLYKTMDMENLMFDF